MSTSPNTTFIKQLSNELRLVNYNQIPVLELDHPVGQAKIALQGAQLLSWQPAGASQDVFWLSEIESFETGVAIRGGVPICYPWFGGKQQPAHGTARLRLWHLSDFQITDQQVKIILSLFDQHQLVEAKLTILFDQHCQISLTHYAQEPAQAALHSYFNIANIDKTEVRGLSTQCYNAVAQQQETAPTPRLISGLVDCIYPAEQAQNSIVDETWQREIHLEHHSASDIVLWNPWHNKMSAMSENAYQNMLCLETARINKLLKQGESVAVKIGVRNKS
ncbi:D-hexose-6-phosphate mutarotase [[Haemophilus] felis]|uniref:Putative glucose-6-phosphate 1-epimerase n=1 Tax=[Haemophilus] felis TaxID=123822 RepID=A0A1T0ASN1_9PAST|nr:D-hexose-6-phosphate mutarotase [[Haemophilus] felis]OOR99541.1 D-hexose-6-phosphate mutarotase [[Haemophilus] felis]